VAAQEDHEGSTFELRELIVVVLLSVTTVLTAWSGFQASKWGGSMSISFSQASSARIEAARYDGTANRKLSIQVALFTQWLQASASRQPALADYLAAQFPEPLRTAFVAWRAQGTSGTRAASPFERPEYQLPETAAAKAADQRADDRFAKALADNQRGDNYTALTIAFASVLFFAAISGRMRARRDQWILLGVGLVVFAIAVVLLLSFPKLV
jgi:hypothetical protein